MRFAPGGFAWLVAHEIRVAWRGGSKAATTRIAAWAARAPLLLLASVPAAIGIVLAYVLRHLPDAPTPKVLSAVSVVLLALLFLMLFRAAGQVLRTFHGRGDLDLQLSAPIPPPRILAAKAVGVYGAVGLPFVLIFAPFIVASAAFGHPRWLGLLAMLGVAAVLATSAAFVVARLLFVALGTRRARVVMQVAGAILGAAAFLTSQAVNFAPRSSDALFRALRRLPSPWDWPARAAFGDPLPLLAFVAAAAVSAILATRFAAANFGASDAVSVGPAARPPRTFRSGLLTTLVAKELRLLTRDPELLTQILLRLVYLVPVALLIFRGDASGVFPGPRFAAAGTVFAGMLAASLAWLTICAEDAPDLIGTAPVRASAVERAKLIAACAPPLAVVAAAAVALAPRAPLAAGVMVLIATVAALTGALLQAWFGKPSPRAAFRRAQQSSFVLGIGELILALAWSGVAALLARGSPWALAPGLLAATILAGAVAARRAPAKATPRTPSTATARRLIRWPWRRASTN